MSTIDRFKYISQQVYIYFGLFILIFGVIGGIFNIIVFITLQTFQETTCAFYLTVVSLVNIGQLLIVLLVRVLSEGFNTDILQIAWVCKIHIYIAVWCTLVSMTIMCLAAIDQYVSMSTYRYYCTKRLAHRIIILIFIFWGLYCIFFPIYWNVMSGSCVVIDSNVAIYISHFHLPVLIGLLPLTVMTIFSILAFNKTRTVIRRQINIVRLSRDRQLTAMTLCHVVLVIIITLPFIIFHIYLLNETNENHQEQTAHSNFTMKIITLIYFLSFANSFYIYFCVSKRFRKQLLFVLMKICLNYPGRMINNCNDNQIVPHIETIIDNVQSTRHVTVQVQQFVSTELKNWSIFSVQKNENCSSSSSSMS